MAATEISICNLALSHLGDDATVAAIDPPEGSAQAEHCAQFYPIARDSLLTMRDWSFARRRAILAPLEANPTDWLYAYARPADALKIRRVEQPGQRATPGPGIEVSALPFDTDADAIYCDAPGARLVYTFPQVDPVQFSPIFVDCLALLLASYLAGPIIKGETGRKAASDTYQAFMRKLSDAATSDADQAQIVLDHAAPWIGSRTALTGLER